MGEYTWADPITPFDGPPLRRKPRFDRGAITTIAKQNWEDRRERITILYRDEGYMYTVAQIQSTLAAEGFETSEREIRRHLEAWGIHKYLKLTEAQWEFIVHEVKERSLRGKGTSFERRLPQGGTERLRSDKIQRTLNCKLSRGHSFNASGPDNSRISGGSIVPCTPRMSQGSNGIVLDPTWNIPSLEPAGMAGMPPALGSSDDTVLDFDHDYQLQLTDVECALTTRDTLWLYFKDLFRALVERFPDANLRIRTDDGEMTVFCGDCQSSDSFRGNSWTLLHDFFTEYEHGHMRSQQHDNMVRKSSCEAREASL